MSEKDLGCEVDQSASISIWACL